MEESHRSFIDSLIGERIAGRYVVERVVRSGGMGLVAAGRYPELDQEVAIKFMRPEFAANPILSARFLREARLAARVKSPHFVRVFDFGRLTSGVPYLVMEMLAGRDLRDELDANGALAPEVAVDYLLHAAVGLAEVHALGVVHRDLKPSNLFLSEAAGSRTIKVLDFGVSKESKSLEGAALTSTGNLVGTPQYMSPEQVRESKTADVRSDVWSLGVILYELLTDRVPFGGDGEAIGEIYGLILHTDPIPLRTRKPELSPELDAVVTRCLQRDPAARYANVGELADALAPFASAGSRARVEAVHHALASARPQLLSSDDDEIVSVPRQPTAATAESSPAAKRHMSPRPETSMTSSRAPEVPAGPSARRQSRVMGGVFAAVALLGAAGIGVAFRGSKGVTASPPIAPTVSAPPRADEPSPAATTSAATLLAPPATSAPIAASASATSIASTSPAHVKPRRPPPSRPGSAPSAAPSGPPADLLLDRK